MKFFVKIRDSIYNPAFYKKVVSTPLESALSYFFILIVLLSFIQIVFLAFPLFIGVKELQNSTLPKAISQYPANLQVKITDGIVTTNAKEPYIVAMPPQDTSTSYQNLVVIDTKDPYSQKEFNNFNVAILITRDSLYYRGTSNSQIQNVPLTGINMIVDRSHLNADLQKYSPYFVFAIPIVLFFFFIGSIILFLFRLIYCLFFAIFVWLLSHVINPKLTYSQSYRVSIHVITLGLIVEAIIQILNPVSHLHGFPFMITIISFVIYLLNFLTNHESK